VIGRGRYPRILVAATLRWPLAARMAIAFRKLGCPVQAWCPAGHPLEKTRAVERIHRASALAPQRSLLDAIRAAGPDFIVPCDDDAVLHLEALHGQGAHDRAVAPARGRRRAPTVREQIEYSLGAPASCRMATSRGELMRLAAAEGVRAPATAWVLSPADLDDWGARHGFPAVLKVDRSWGGLGVTVVRDVESARVALRGATQPSLARALSHLVLRRDPSHLLRRFSGARPAVTIQAFIAGQPANRAVACWRGEVLAGISVMALQTQGPTGPATVVQVVAHEEMEEAARRLVRALGVSGFCSLDFVIESGTDAAHVIEVNPRATPISHLALGAGRDLPAALFARLRGEAAPAGTSEVRGDVIAMFPGEWRRNPQSAALRAAHHDVPWAEDELVRDCVALPWEERGVAARVRALLDPQRAAAPAWAPPPQVQPAAGTSPPE